MSIIYLQNKQKSKYTLNLIPERTWASSSSGISGSVYVFPNRSHLQKDNIDERLELAAYLNDDGVSTTIRPYTDNSLEAFRQQIYSESFLEYKVIKIESFEAMQYIRNFLSGYAPELTQYFYQTLGNRVIESKTLSRDEAQQFVDVITSNADSFWDGYTDRFSDTVLNIVSVDYQDIVSYSLTEYEQFARDINGDQINLLQYNLPLELLLAVLLDGAHPAAIDHVYRPYNEGIGPLNDPNDPETSVFSGNTIIDLTSYGTEYVVGDLIKSKDNLRLWPPEIDKYMERKEFKMPYTTIGYSDVSMHPRNSTKKDITLERCNQSITSKANLAQKAIYNNLSTLITKDFGWWIDNKFALNLSTWEDELANQYTPTISYWGNFEKTANDDFMIEFWIKPSINQVEDGVVVQYSEKNYSVKIRPNGDKFKIVFEWGTDQYISNSELNIDQWNHICIRYSPNYNNGYINIIVNLVSNDNLGQLGQINTDNLSRLFVGGVLENIEEYYVDSSYQGFDFNGSEDSMLLEVSGSLKCEMHELRIWNTAKDINSIREFMYTTLDDVSELSFYVPFTFETSTEDKEWLKYLWFGKEDATEIEEFYENFTIEVPNSALGAYWPLNINNAFVTGVPFLNVHQYLKNKAGNMEIAYISGFPSLLQTVGDTNDYFPNNLKFTMVNWMEQWQNCHWLQCINSMVIPLDNKDFVNSVNPYIDMSIHPEGDVVTNDLYLSPAFNDEILQTLESLDEEKPIQLNDWLKENGTWFDKTTNLDFLNPTSIIINVPQIFYGNYITPSTIEITANLTKDKTITLRDKEGVLYISNAEHEYSSKVGHIDYNNGFIVIFHPSLVNIGQFDYSIKFNGNKNMHVMQIDVPCGKHQHNISKNASWDENLKPSNNANEANNGFKVISNINLHDDNLNVIAKVTLAQPIIKRNDDNFVFRVKLDF